MKKKILFLTVLLAFSAATYAQPTIELGIKAGLNNSKVTFKKSEFNTESIVKTHVGAYGRVGFGNIYVQPELYFSAKGGDVMESGSSTSERVARFNFNNVDVPVLVGIKIFNGENSNLRIMAGPVFSFLTSKEVIDHDSFTKENLQNHYYGYQYGMGVDIWNFFLDIRMEHGANNLYSYPNRNLEGKNKTFMVTAGFRIL